MNYNIQANVDRTTIVKTFITGGIYIKYSLLKYVLLLLNLKYLCEPLNAFNFFFFYTKRMSVYWMNLIMKLKGKQRNKHEVGRKDLDVDDLEVD